MKELKPGGRALGRQGSVGMGWVGLGWGGRRRQIAKTWPSCSIEAESQRSWPAALAEDSGKSSTTVSQSSINIVGISIK